MKQRLRIGASFEDATVMATDECVAEKSKEKSKDDQRQKDTFFLSEDSHRR